MLKLCLLAEASSAHTRRWATYFAQHGWHVDVLSLRPGEISGVDVHVVGLPLDSRLAYFGAIPKVRRLVAALRPDLLHAHYATSYGLLGALAGRHPLVISAWGTDVFDDSSPLVRQLLRFNFGRADAVCATSEALATQTRKYVPRGQEIHVTPFGVDLGHFRPEVDIARKNGFIVGSTRSLERLYGLHVLIEAFAKVRRERHDARLTLIGSGSQRGPLGQQADSLGLSDAVEFRGHVPWDRLPHELSRLDVFVMPSIVPEAFGVAALEAAACELPVVASRTGGLPEVVADGETGLLVLPGNVEAIAAAILKLASDQTLRERLGQAGRRFVAERYEWAENAGRMARLYERILQPRATTPPTGAGDRPVRRQLEPTSEE